MKNTSSPSAILPEVQQTTINPIGLGLIVIVLAFMGITLVQRFGNVEEQREMLRWQNKLNLIADSRAADVDGWFKRQVEELSDVASNPSLQLYLTALMAPAKESAIPQAVMEEPAQAVFLRNLLAMTSERMGFSAKLSDDLKAIRANVARANGSGLGIIDKNGKMIVSTLGLGAFDSSLLDKIQKAPKDKPSFLDVFKDAGGEMRIGFVVPIYTIQGDRKADQQIAKLVGIRSLNRDVLQYLVQPGVADKTLETVLLRQDDGNVAVMGAHDGDAEMGQVMPPLSLKTPELDASFALSNPGLFSLKRDWQSNLVLMTSRPLVNVPWVLMLHVDRAQALRESDRWRVSMQIIMVAALVALICSIVAAWWYGSSRKATLLAKQTARLAAYSVAQERLLRLVSDNQPEPVFIADNKQVVRFANEKTAERFKLNAADILGKNLASLMGPDMAKAYAENDEAAMAVGRPLVRTHRVGSGLDARTFSSTHVPLEHIPVDGLPYPTPGALVVDQDITDIVSERERRERILHQLINTLVRMVDARDPYAANHSQAVSVAAREVAQSLGLPPALTETARIAGKIMNIGKIVVPSEVLTRRKPLDEEELLKVRESLTRSAGLLQGIEFDGPVVETLRQSAERVDGKGPLGMTGEAILVTARIIAVANSFVGMISARSYRDALSVELATGTLLQNIDTLYDRKIVVALINFVENKHGRDALLKVLARKAD